MRPKKNEMNLKEVIALITLLDDPDDGIYWMEINSDIYWRVRIYSFQIANGTY